MGQRKPVFQNVVDLGLRDVGIRNQPRRLAAIFGKLTVAGVALAVVLAIVACFMLRRIGAERWMVMAFALAAVAAMVGLTLRSFRRAPVVVVKVDASGTNQATWMMIAAFVLLSGAAVGLNGPAMVPVLVLSALTAALLFRARGQAPALVRAVRDALAPDEAVLGDGIGAVQRDRRQPLRLIACTDRRLLVATRDRTGAVSFRVDAPYADVQGFGIRWALAGRMGVLTLTLAGAGAPQVIGSIAPLNLLSIARALRSKGVPSEDPTTVAEAERVWAATGPPAAPRGTLRGTVATSGVVRILALLLAAVAGLVVMAAATGFELVVVRLAVQEATADRLPVDGRSNLTGGAASFAYTPGPGLRELVTDQDFGVGPNDGARWELRSPFMRGENVVSLSHYIFVPRLDDPAAVAAFVAGKDVEHSRIAGHPVSHTERVVDGRRGYVWTHGNRLGYWHHAVWFPHPVHTIRVECIAKRERQRFGRLCAEALASLEFGE